MIIKLTVADAVVIVSFLVIIVVAVVPTTTVHISHAQFGEQQSDGDGGLTATLNGETFTRGDPVTIRGTVSETGESASLYVQIRDPDGIRIRTWSVPVNNDLTFIHGFTAGQLRDMDKFGTYQITVKYFPPGTESGTETTDLSFEYVSGTTATTTTEAEANTTTTITMDAEVVKAVKMAVHESMVQAYEYTEQANIAMQNNDTQAVFGNLTLIENELDNIRWNMTDIKLPTSTDRIG